MEGLNETIDQLDESSETFEDFMKNLEGHFSNLMKESARAPKDFTGFCLN